MLTEFTQVESSGQLLTFGLGILFGCVACIVYDLLYTTRCVFRHNIWYITGIDVIYFFLLSLAVYCFLLVRCNGEVRLFPLLAMLVGFALIKFSVSPWIRIGLTTVYRWCFAVLKWILHPFYRFFRYFSHLLYRFYQLTKNIFKSRKKPLANDIDLDV